MVSSFSRPAEAAITSDQLVALLRQSDEALERLRERATVVMAHEDPASLGSCPRQTRTLCGILDHGRGRIQRRLSILTRQAFSGAASAAVSLSPVDSDNPLAFMAEYRACCRLLCRALNESLRISNSPTVALLSDFVLRLEKQLWLMDTPRHHSGSEPYRSVSLFLTC